MKDKIKAKIQELESRNKWLNLEELKEKFLKEENEAFAVAIGEYITNEKFIQFLKELSDDGNDNA